MLSDASGASINVGTVGVIPVKVSPCVEPVLCSCVGVYSQLEPPEEKDKQELFNFLL